MYTQEFSTALNRCCKHNGQSARRCRCQQKPDAAQSPHTVNRRSVSGQRSKYVVDRRSRYENRTSRFNTYCCNSKFSTLIITLSLTLAVAVALILSSGCGLSGTWLRGHVTALDQSQRGGRTVTLHYCRSSPYCEDIWGGDIAV